MNDLGCFTLLPDEPHCESCHRVGTFPCCAIADEGEGGAA